MDIKKLWPQIRMDLDHARKSLLCAAADDKSISQYEEFIAHNELELACDMLEAYAETHAVNKEFWLALRNAAEKMELYERAHRYESLATP